MAHLLIDARSSVEDLSKNLASSSLDVPWCGMGRWRGLSEVLPRFGSSQPDAACRSRFLLDVLLDGPLAGIPVLGEGRGVTGGSRR